LEREKGERNLYQTGDQIVYGVHGVCRIVDIETKRIDRTKISYYALEPIDQPGARYYVPTEKPAAVAKMRPLLDEAELMKLLSTSAPNQKLWIPDENQRKQQYRELVGSGEREILVSLILLLHNHRKQQEELGKKFHLCDETILRDCEKLLTSEISVVLSLPAPQALRFLREKLEV
jgi:CarD family transcriptional regulator